MYDDPVAFAVRELSSSLGGGLYVGGRIPNPRPAEFIRVVFSGATFRSLVHREARVTVECWSTSDASATALAERALAALLEAGDSWNSVLTPERWAGGPAALPDPETGSPRIVFTASLTQRSR